MFHNRSTHFVNCIIVICLLEYSLQMYVWHVCNKLQKWPLANKWCLRVIAHHREPGHWENNLVLYLPCNSCEMSKKLENIKNIGRSEWPPGVSELLPIAHTSAKTHERRAIALFLRHPRVTVPVWRRVLTVKRRFASLEDCPVRYVGVFWGLFVELQGFSNTVFWPNERGSFSECLALSVTMAMNFLRLKVLFWCWHGNHSPIRQMLAEILRPDPKLPPAYCWQRAWSWSTEVTETSG